jgi:transcriptional regulator with XRE-family HTH domain
MEIGDRIKHARIAAGLSQRELATLVGVSHGIIGQWEAHIKKPGRETLRRLAQALIIDPGALLRDVGDPDKHGVLVTDQRQIDMLRRFVLLSPDQQDNLLKFLGIARDVRLEIEHRREPSHRRLAPADAA